MKNPLLLNALLNHGYDSSIFNQDEISLTSLVDEVIYCALSYKENPQNMIIVKNNAFEANQFYDYLLNFMDDDKCYLFTPEESLRVEAIASSPENKAQTIEVMYKMLDQKHKIIVTSSSAFVRYLPDPQLFISNTIHIKKDDEYKIEALKEQLIKAGYKHTSRVDLPLTFSVRGGIIDVYSINNESPIRIEFFDTMVESIRHFDVQTQRTIDFIDETTIVPATTLMFSSHDVETLNNIINEKLPQYPQMEHILNQDLDYINHSIVENHLYIYYSYLDEVFTMRDYVSDPLIILIDEEKIKRHIKTLFEDTMTYIQEMAQANKMLPRFSVFSDFDKLLSKQRVIKSEGLMNYHHSALLEINIPRGDLNFKMQQIIERLNDYKLIYLKEHDVKDVLDYLIEHNIPYNLSDEIDKGINIYFDEISEGFEFKDILVVTSKELLNQRINAGKYVNKYKNAIALEDYQQLEKYDYVVHNQYGIGQYIGIVTKEHNGIHKDYLQVLYAEDDELLIPIDQFHLIRKYASHAARAIKLHKLGSNKWVKTKERVQENLRDLAKRLTELYNQRDQQIGHAYKADTHEQKQFEDEFEFVLTDDQQTAVEAIKKDMESSYPMDRLLCGDVGFGKTEVAIIASFKAVQEGKQVAFLCPTTVLAMQHYQTYLKRFKNYPINIEVLNRFVSVTKQKEIIKNLELGLVDIVIGTHRVLSKDIKFKDLGLLIIDEEQRFGVEHKEKIKELKEGIDVLALSATPIPRTLQMSLIGMRQLSTLNTPPMNRLPVQTYVVEKTAGLIVEIIQRELLRNGQVFYLYNNISRIYETARVIQHKIKDAKVAVVHGQMEKDEIEDVMLAFNRNEINVLVCTTIIETGIDIPNANTIIIEDAHKFGLSQLYQIKGRVGRSSRIGYAYLLVPKHMQVSELQEKRLKAIKEFTELGSGYKIAQRDLTIRGAGEILGPSQSGFIDDVGIELYLEMLKDAINEEKGIYKEEIVPKRQTVKSDAYIPQQYAPDDYEKIDVYKRLNQINQLDDLYDFEMFIKDRHGKMPKNVVNVFRKKELELIADESYIESFKETNVATIVEFTREFSERINGVKLFEKLNKISKTIGISYKNQRIVLNIPKTKNNLDFVLKVIKEGKKSKR